MQINLQFHKGLERNTILFKNWRLRKKLCYATMAYTSSSPC